jgi:sulfite reductase (ferredoxin)
MSETHRETKAQRAERLKAAKNPWEALDELRQYCRRGYGAVPDDWLSTYLRWWGVYTQGDGAGVLGGVGGEGKTVPYFMIRIRIPNGVLLAHQLHAVADLAARYARGVADITVRQNIQLHWIAAEALPEVLDSLFRCGLTSMAACGDDTRNITGCPLAGLDADELCDASQLAFEASRMLVGNPDFYNLPRKYKICVTGCRAWCSYPEINDVALTALPRSRNGQVEMGFSLRVGGGLSTQPHLAVPIGVFVHREQALPVIRAATEIFRDSAVLRESRERARMKFLFLNHGWTAERFREELELRLGYGLDPAEPEEIPEDVYRDHVGIHPQKQRGLCYVGISVERGRITADQMRAAAELSERFAGGLLRTTGMQNLVVVNVPQHNAVRLASELGSVGLRVEASPFWRGIIACTGTEFCKLAITETKGFSRWLAEQLEDRLPEFDQRLKLHVTGCPNSCGQHWIADIGIEGKKLKVGGQLVDAYYFCLGGSTGKLAAIARPVGYRCPAAEVPDAIERLLQQYLALRSPGEDLREFFGRHSDEELRSFLAGHELEAAARDVPAGRVPPGVEG